MVKLPIEAWTVWLKRLITEPRSELTRWQRTLRFTYLLGVHGARRLSQGRAQEMAGALAFRTLFGLLPVLVVATLLVRVFQGWEAFYQTAKQFLEALGLDKVHVRVLTGDGGHSIALSQWLLELLAEVETINVTAIGWIGVLVLLYSALGLMITIENSFNAIYGAPRGRSWARRIPDYWLVLCLAPAAIALTLLLDDRIDQWVLQVGSWNRLLSTAGSLWSLGVTWLVMFAIYRVVPNTSVGNRPALAGAGVAALLLSAGRASLGAYFENALSLSQLYGSLGLIPLFMFWVYLMWLAVLYGLEVAAILQTFSRSQLEEAVREPETQHTGLVDPAAVLSLMELVGRRFLGGRSAPPREIADELGLPPRVVERMLDRLAAASLVHRLDAEAGAVTLARPPEQIAADDLIEIGFQLVDEGRPGHRSRLLDEFRTAQRQVASRATLAAMLAG